MKLSPFLDLHPPGIDVEPVSQELLAAFADKLPTSLLELWRIHGLGHYGAQQICLIDPRTWQVTLDRWIVSPPDDAQRIPIAISAFGGIFYYRKLTETDEDVAFLDPHSSECHVLAWSLDDFFNNNLCGNGDFEEFDDLLQYGRIEAAVQQHGKLGNGMVYEVDANLLSMQMLVIRPTDALQMHRRLRDAVDENLDHSTAESLQPAAPLTIRQALPKAWCDVFSELILTETPKGKPSLLRALFNKSSEKNKIPTSSVVGLYLSSFVDDHRLLAMLENNTYHLLFFSSSTNPGYYDAPRYYTGAYAAETYADGETLISLDIERRDDSLGSDAWDASLTMLNSPDARYMLQYESVDDIAAGIQWNSYFGEPRKVFVQVTLDDHLPAYSEYGIKAPLLKYLPPSVRELIPNEPLQVTIISMDKYKKGKDTMVEVNLGTADGLIMNMPFCSPAGATKSLMGWVWALDEKRCKIGIDCEGDKPAIGDILVARSPSAGPLV
jgi:hypothetical protein